jgi:hypothetical protein
VHDSQCVEQGGVYKNFEDQFNKTGGEGVVDSAFSGGRYHFLIKSCQTLPTNATECVVLVNDEAMSLWKSSEWGMRGLQVSFPRLKDRFICEEYGEHLILLLTVMPLYSFCTQYVGINQIRSVYFPYLEGHEANEILDWILN